MQDSLAQQKKKYSSLNQQFSTEEGEVKKLSEIISKEKDLERKEKVEIQRLNQLVKDQSKSLADGRQVLSRDELKIAQLNKQLEQVKDEGRKALDS